jgi:hypothetical protein
MSESRTEATGGREGEAMNGAAGGALGFKPGLRTSRRVMFVLLLILVGGCVLVGVLRYWLLLALDFVANILLDDACRTGGTWARWALAGISIAVVAEIALWIRVRPRRPGWVAVLVGITATAAVLVAIPTLSCLGPSTKWVDSSSQPPCWGPICPGRTSHSQVLDILHSDPDVAADSIRRYEYEGYRIVEWSFAQQDEGRGTAYFFRDGPVIAIWFTVHGITLGNVVRRFGEPELFEAGGGGFEGGFRFVRLLYAERGIEITGDDRLHWKPQDGKERLDESMPAERIVFFDTEAPKEQLAVPFLLGSEVLDDFASFQVWQGFGLVTYTTDNKR